MTIEIDDKYVTEFNTFLIMLHDKYMCGKGTCLRLVCVEDMLSQLCEYTLETQLKKV